jgi:predicted membrane protein
MIEFLFILFGLIGLCFIVLLTSIIKDYIVNKKSTKKRPRPEPLTRKEAKELRDRLHNMGKPPWVRNYNKLTDKKNRK